MKHICKNCKYFEPDKYYNLCNNIKIDYIQMFTEFDKKSDKAVYTDYESFDAFFYVGENFGCIHWEMKESEE